SSTFHTFWWDPLTGVPLRGTTAQGYSDDSCWARGQAWGIYGFALAYATDGDESLLRASERLADYFIDHLPADNVPYWDLVFSDGSGQPRDASSGAIAYCALALLQRLGRDAIAADKLSHYRTVSRSMLASLAEHYTPVSNGVCDALLLHSVYDMPQLVGVDEGCLWGDYFYLEALVRDAQPDWVSYWETTA
ncbi:MAG: glycoside hydrolase family 88 protein, partial [Propionibacteriaceae bacterium]|nr:glycoside hydrolase family 88 protein [Propionibacteriaceae bacterium]